MYDQNILQVRLADIHKEYVMCTNMCHFKELKAKTNE